MTENKNICPNCGQATLENDKFCGGCGAILTQEAESDDTQKSNETIQVVNKEIVKSAHKTDNKESLKEDSISVEETISKVVAQIPVINEKSQVDNNNEKIESSNEKSTDVDYEEKELMKCPNCNQFVEKKSKYCQHCGSFIEKEENNENIGQNGINENLINCPGCGNMVSKKAEMCPRCGHPFPENKQVIVNQTATHNSGGSSGIGFWGVVFAIIFAILIMSFC